MAYLDLQLEIRKDIMFKYKVNCRPIFFQKKQKQNNINLVYKIVIAALRFTFLGSESVPPPQKKKIEPQNTSRSIWSNQC